MKFRRLCNSKGNHYCLTIPKKFIEELGWDDKDEIAIYEEEGKLVLLNVNKQKE